MEIPRRFTRREAFLNILLKITAVFVVLVMFERKDYPHVWPVVVLTIAFLLSLPRDIMRLRYPLFTMDKGELSFDGKLRRISLPVDAIESVIESRRWVGAIVRKWLMPTFYLVGKDGKRYEVFPKEKDGEPRVTALREALSGKWPITVEIKKDSQYPFSM